jgi:cytochrome c oxidase cbb3-type subunit IV
MMEFATLGSIITVLAVIAFAGIVAWTMSRRQDERFETASRLPFALPDETAVAPIRHDQPGAGQ